MNTEASNTTLGPGSAETAAPDTTALATMDGNGETALATREAAPLDGTYKPPEAKMYSEYMKIAYGVGFGAELGCPTGSLVLGKKDVLVGPKTPLTCIILGARGFWSEWKPYDGSNFPRDFATEAEARKAGLRTQNPPMGSGLPMRNCAPAVDLALFVKKPEGGTTSPAFNYVLNGDEYAAVRFTVDRAQFGEIEKSLDNLVKMDAASRGVKPAEGKLSAFFVTFSTLPEIVKKSDKTVTKVHLYLNLVLDANKKPVKVGEEVVRDIAAINAQIKAQNDGQAEPDNSDEGGF